MPEVAELWASLGARQDARAWAAADARIRAADRALAGTGRTARRAGGESAAGAGAAEKAWGRVRAIATGAVAFVGLRAGYQALIKFNATAEESRNQIAGMLALSKQTKFSDELGTADGLMASLSKRAASLPGTTAEYIKMLGNIAQPVTKAGLGVQELEDLTVGAVVAAKALGEEAEAAARDVGQALRGQAGADDPFIGKLLDTAGFEGQAGRAKFNAKTAKERAAIVKQLLTSPQLTEMAEAQGKTFPGLLATLQDSLSQFFGRVGKPLFEGLSSALKDVNAWLAANEATLKEIADVAGGVLLGAFNLLGDAFSVLADNLDVVLPILVGIAGAFAAVKVQAALAWLAATGPIALFGAAIVGAIALIAKLIREPGKVKAAFRAAWEGIKAGAVWLWDQLAAIGARIRAFFVDDIPEAIKGAFKAAFEAVRDAAKSLLDSLTGSLSPADLARKASEIEARKRGGGGAAPQSAPALPPSAVGASTASYSTTVDVGGINVTSSSADPKAVALEVRRAVTDELGGMLRRTRDEVG